MIKALFILLFTLGIPSVWSQNLTSGDLQFLETQNTLGSPFTIPISINLLGDISILGSTEGLSFSPLGQIAFSKSTSLFIQPLQSKGMAFLEQAPNKEWIEVKRRRYEFGLGLKAIAANGYLPLGLTPYKGARQVMVRLKKTSDEPSSKIAMPNKLSELSDWGVGDQGSFQRYGGIQASLGFSASYVSVASVSFTLQGLWTVQIQKISENKITINLNEEDYKKRSLSSGVPVLNAALSHYKGKRFSIQFELNLTDKTHHDLFRLVLEGKIDDIQKALPTDAQDVKWTGNDKLFYYGIPYVVGKTHQRSHYDLTFQCDAEAEEDILDIKSKLNNGLLLPLRNHYKLVYQTGDNFTLFWYSEMNHAKQANFEKYFLNPGRIIGVKGFDSRLAHKEVLGSTLTQLGVSFTQEEMSSISDIKLDEIATHFKNKCEQEKLDCQREKVYSKIMRSFQSLMRKPWTEIRQDLGFLMLNEPALVHAIVRGLKLKKMGYFKFLSEHYQSLEGSALIQY